MNKQEEKAYMKLDKFILENNVKPLVTKEIIEEHRKKPIGQHSANLFKVLNFLRRHHDHSNGKDLIICTVPHEEWCLGEHPGERNKAYILFSDEKFDSREAAEHGLFLKRLKIHGLIDESMLDKGEIN